MNLMDITDSTDCFLEKNRLNLYCMQRANLYDGFGGENQIDGRDRIDGKDRFDGKDRIDGAFFLKE